MSCPPVVPQGVPANASAEDLRNLIDQASEEAIHGATQEIRDRAWVRMLVLQQYQSDLVNCHMSAQVLALTRQIAALHAAVAGTTPVKAKGKAQ